MDSLSEKKFYEALGAVPDLPEGLLDKIENSVQDEYAEESLNEKRFYAALSAVPEVPAGILERIERLVHRSGVKRRISLAACLLLALIIPALLITNQGSTSVAYADDTEAMDELLYAFDFISGGFDDAGYMFDMDTYDDGGRGVSAVEAAGAAEASESTAVAKSIAKKGD
ncbi:MAG: hypothetical protein FWC23_08845 [Chitinispirillia bacterium]|nr:hypothetical protein [Chitinispirillia bacterium]MCL2269276.1 hypothetical protein [Chitinispirillia bacterium]